MSNEPILGDSRTGRSLSGVFFYETTSQKKIVMQAVGTNRWGRALKWN